MAGSAAAPQGRASSTPGNARLELRDRHLIAVIGDQDTVTGMLLAGVGHVDSRPHLQGGQASHSKRNYFVADSKTPVEAVEEAFREMVGRRDVAIVLITQHIANIIRAVVDEFDQMLPAVVEIPSKDHPYDPEHDSVMRHVNRLFSNE